MAKQTALAYIQEHGVIRVAIVGSRKYTRLSLVAEFARRLPSRTLVISGGAPGVDTVAEDSAANAGLATLTIPYDDRYGRAGGMIRNTEIVRWAQVLVAFWDGESSGTADSIRKARATGKQVFVIR